jgi:2-methylcitrate dehydratase PrpD
MISDDIASFVSSTKYSQLPADVLTMARQSLLDWVGSAIRGSIEPPARMFADLAREEGGAPRATALPDGWKTSATWASQINAAASHTMEMDDLHPSAVFHPAAPVMSAAVALGEAVDATGVDLVEAVVVGYEVGVRAGEAAGGTHYDLWHTTATCGTFGAAAAAAKLLKLDPPRIAQALGSAGTQAAGLWQFLEDGAMSKQLHPAHAAGAGILAAELARRGFTGARAIFEGEKGFLAAMSKQPQPDALTKGLGCDYRMADNSFKKHASCRHTHSAIDAALRVREETEVRAFDLKEILVHVYPAAHDLLDGIEPTTPYAAKFSLPFTVATAMCRGQVGLEDFDDIEAKDVRDVLPKVRVVRDESLGADYPVKWPARVVVRLNDGRSFGAQVEFPRGDVRNPLTQEELDRKFRTLTDTILTADQQDHLMKASKEIERFRVRQFWPF